MTNAISFNYIAVSPSFDFLNCIRCMFVCTIHVCMLSLLIISDIAYCHAINYNRICIQSRHVVQSELWTRPVCMVSKIELT